MSLVYIMYWNEVHTNPQLQTRWSGDNCYITFLSKWLKYPFLYSVWCNLSFWLCIVLYASKGNMSFGSWQKVISWVSLSFLHCPLLPNQHVMFMRRLIRQNEQLSNYGDTKLAWSITLVELKKLIELFREKLTLPVLCALINPRSLALCILKYYYFVLPFVTLRVLDVYNIIPWTFEI